MRTFKQSPNVQGRSSAFFTLNVLETRVVTEVVQVVQVNPLFYLERYKKTNKAYKDFKNSPTDFFPVLPERLNGFALAQW